MTNRRPRQLFVILWGVILLSASVVGCRHAAEEREAAQGTNAEPVDLLREFRSAVERKDWPVAEKLSNEVLTLFPDDADAIESVAMSLFGQGQVHQAADLLVDACTLESFGSARRVGQAMAALLTAGRLLDCLELLEASLAKHPDRHDHRRALYQMCWGVEDRPRSLQHAEYLIRQRQFDVDLLLTLCDVGLRKESPDSMVTMAERCPADPRPLVALARVQFDQGNLHEAFQTLGRLRSKYPGFAPANALLARVLVDLNEEDRFVSHIAQCDAEAKKHAFYWMAVGDWCRVRHLPSQAARAYWEATNRDPDSRQAWMRLGQMFRQMDKPLPGLAEKGLESIDQTFSSLTKLAQLREQFVQSNKQSQEIACAIALTLADLKRLWEAEAWASIATTLPVDSDVSAKQVRQEIVARLRKSSPWRVPFVAPEFVATVEALALPDLSGIPRTSEVARGEVSAFLKNMTPLGEIRLSNEADLRGLHFFGKTGEDLASPGIRHYQTLGCGGGTIDFDLDGWDDLYLAAAGGEPLKQNSANNALWRNLEGKFVEVTTTSNSTDWGFGQGIAVGDVNEDGFPDLLVLNYGANTLLVNNGDGTFANHSDRLNQSPSDSQAWSSSGAVADMDRDGIADLFVVNYGAGSGPFLKECRQQSTGLDRACSPLVFPGVADQFLGGDGQGNFRNAPGRWPEPAILGRGLGIEVGVFDNQPGIDVLIANDLTSNHFWSVGDSGSGSVTESGLPRGLASDERAPAQGSMGIAVADFDGDGDADFYVTNFAGEANTLHEQGANGIWQDRTVSLELSDPTMPMVGFGTEAVDFDNNGVVELVVTNGHVDQYPGKDASPYAQPMQLFQRRSVNGYTAVDSAALGAYCRQPHIGRALWTIDADRDGLTDLVVTHQSEPVALLANRTDGAGASMALRLVGRDCSRDAIGAKIEVQANGMTLTQFVTAGHGYLCSNERLLRFGLGNATQKDFRATVTWPDGSSQSFPNLKPHSQWLVVQGEPSPFRLDQ